MSSTHATPSSTSRARGSGTAAPSLIASPAFRRLYAPAATAIQILIDTCAIAAACVVAYAGWSRIQPLPRVVPFSEYAPLFAWIIAVELVLFAQFRLYAHQKTILNIEEFKGILKAVVLGFLLTAVVQFLLEESVIFPRSDESGSSLYRLLARVHHAIAFLPANTLSRYVILLAFAFTFLFMSIQRWVCFKAHQFLHLRGVGTKNILVIGTAPIARTVQKTLFLSPRLGDNFVGYLSEDPAEAGRPIGRYRVLGTTDELAAVIAAFKIGMVLVALPQLDREQLRRFALTCGELGTEFAFLPPLAVTDDLPPLRVSSVQSVPLLSFAPVPTGPLYAAMKRLLDLVLASVAVIVNLPLFVVLPLWIRLDSRGPVIFTQDRIGKDGRRFRIYKFRTMHSDLPKYGASPRSSSDPRLTRLGRMLRRTSLDELPQLFNVLKGDMSIVGPRPEQPFIVERYDQHLKQRLRAKPGMTGLWQISHAREEDIHENADYDLYYVAHPSITMDVVILILTVFSVIRGVGAR